MDKNHDSFGEHYNKIREWIERFNLESNNQKKVQQSIHDLNFLKDIVQVLDKWIENISWISELRHLQKLTLSGFINFLIRSFEDQQKTGYIVMPTGQWKTIISVLLSLLNPLKSIIITDNKQWTSQFLKTWNLFETYKDQIWEIQTDTRNQKKLIIWWWRNFQTALEDALIDLSQYSLIIIDEADVNGLSPNRQELLNSIIEQHQNRIVGITATEQQRFRELSEFYTYDILRFPMPWSLPELYQIWELPNTRFVDVYLEWELLLGSKPFGDASDDWIDNFIMNTSWIDQILSYHIEHNLGKKFILGMRNNRFNELIILQAKERWLYLMALSDQVNQPQRIAIIEKLINWEIDGIIWSRLTGRGLDIPECEVVYNSLLTYSPQLFWQLAGRGIRLDKNNQQKQAQIITFLPKSAILQASEINDSQDGSHNKTRYILPLCFEGFLDSRFYTKEPTMHLQEKSYMLEHLSQQEIVSIKEVNNFLFAIRNYGSYSGKPEILTKIIRVYHSHISMKVLVDYILRIRWSKVKSYFQKEENYFVDNSEEEQKEFDEYLKRYVKDSNRGNLTIYEEKMLFEKYQNDELSQEDRNKIRDTILSYHYPIIIAIAQNYNRRAQYPLEDLIQAWATYVIEKMELFRGAENRFAGYCAIYALSWMTRYHETYKDIISTPIYLQHVANKSEKEIIKQEQTWRTLSSNEKMEIIAQTLEKWKKSIADKILLYLERQYEAVDESMSPLEDPVLAELIKVERDVLVNSIVDSLPPEHKDLITKYYREWMNYREIWEQSWRSTQAIQQKITRIITHKKSPFNTPELMAFSQNLSVKKRK